MRLISERNDFILDQCALYSRIDYVGHIGKTIVCFQKWPKDDAESALCSSMSTRPVDIYEVKRSQRHLLAAIEKNRLVSPIGFSAHLIHFSESV